MGSGSSPPVPGTGAFDYAALGEAVENRRQELELTPSGLARSIDWLSAAPLSRYRLGNPNPSCQFAIGVLRWLGRSPESFSPGMRHGTEHALPDFGPYSLRFNMATLWLAVEERRTERCLTWEEVNEQTLFPAAEHIRRECYGISMHDLMNVVRWLGRPAADFTYPSGLAPARPGSAAYGGPAKTDAQSTAPDLGQVYLMGTRGKTDEEIEAFALTRGGFANICYTIMMGLRTRPAGEDFEVAMDLGEGLAWTMRSRGGRTSFDHKAKRSTTSRLTATPADFMRLVFADLDPKHACLSGRVAVDGDLDQVVRAFVSFASRQSPPPVDADAS